MAATEQSRTFRPDLGAVIVIVLDDLGNLSTHTIYVYGTFGVTDINAAIAQTLAAIDEATAKLHAAFQAAGWTGGSQTS
jgi:hypothetical protein